MVEEINAMQRPAAPAGRRPLDSERSKFLRTTASPFSSAWASASSTVTGMPAMAKFMAMPPPMVPQPTTAARSTTLPGAPPPPLAADLSAKNTCESALL